MLFEFCKKKYSSFEADKIVNCSVLTSRIEFLKLVHELNINTMLKGIVFIYF